MRGLLKPIERVCLAVSAVALLALVVGVAVGSPGLWRPAAIVGTVALAIGLGAVPALDTYRFTLWVVAAVTAAFLAPGVFRPFPPGSTPYRYLLLVMIQAVMFGMGTQMSLRDFVGVVRTPWPVAVGIICQFTIMPLLGYGLAIAFRLPSEIAAGMVLIGACSSGLASNVMSYISGANLPLSIALSAITTMLAPVITPMWFTYLASDMLAGTTIELSFLKMMADIIKIVIVPIGAALVHDFLKNIGPAGRRAVMLVALVGVIVLLAALAGGWSSLVAGQSKNVRLWCELTLWILGGVAFGVVYHWAVAAWPWLDRMMPLLAMFGIVYVTGMTSAEGRENLLNVGAVLLVAAGLHNVLGYLLGYWMSRALGMVRQSSRTVAFEVGMQNGGMATGLANEMGKLGTLGLAAAVFIVWMNISGSLLANYWRRRPLRDAGDLAAPCASQNE
jgi:BASS family bile acid:Na+ symporter